MRTDRAFVRHLEITQHDPCLVTDVENGIFPLSVDGLAVLIVDVAEVNIRRIVLKKAQAAATRDGCRKMELQVAFAALFFALEDSEASDSIGKRVHRGMLGRGGVLIERAEDLHDLLLLSSVSSRR
jgi:hypothetical protein